LTHMLSLLAFLSAATLTLRSKATSIRKSSDHLKGLLIKPVASTFCGRRGCDRGWRGEVDNTNNNRAILSSQLQTKAGKFKKDWDTLPVSNVLKPGDPRPKLLVFDLDNTCWTPELYQLRTSPKPWRDIRLFKPIQAIMHELATKDEWKGTKVAAASRTHQVNWAHRLISKFEIAPETTMDDLFSYKEIYPGSKRKHFERLKRDSGVSFDEMIFFDDSTWNTDEIERMGVLCVFCPRGMTNDLWELSLKEYAKMKKKKTRFMGKTLSASRASTRRR